MKTRTVIDWRWERGQVTVTTCSSAEHPSQPHPARQAETLQPGRSGEYAPEFLAGWQAQAYDVTLPNAWEQGKTEMREMARPRLPQDIPPPTCAICMTADISDGARIFYCRYTWPPTLSEERCTRSWSTARPV
jgi:hypothetical protein